MVIVGSGYFIGDETEIEYEDEGEGAIVIDMTKVIE